jgi:hypothetical protein
MHVRGTRVSLDGSYVARFSYSTLPHVNAWVKGSVSVLARQRGSGESVGFHGPIRLVAVVPAVQTSLAVNPNRDIL